MDAIPKKNKNTSPNEHCLNSHRTKRNEQIGKDSSKVRSGGGKGEGSWDLRGKEEGMLGLSGC